jgi:membrane protein YdbS with pleckstrin-like domain
MNIQNKKVIGISNWYFFYKMTILISGCLMLFLMFLIILEGYDVEYTNKSLPIIIAAVLPVLVFLYVSVNHLLYWSKSGVYVNEGGDHIVYLAGLHAKEDKLLNGVVIANQISQGPLEQLFGIATMTTGLFENRPIAGVRYRDIKTYEDLMRSGNLNGVVSML